MRIDASTPEERQLIDARLVAFNREQVPFTQDEAWIDLSYVLKNDMGQVMGGINAMLYGWNILYIDVLHVDSAHRGNGYGKLLLDKAEQHAKSLGGYMAHLDTFDWQAKAFYEGLGYEVFGVLKDCPRGHDRYYMKKVF